MENATYTLLAGRVGTFNKLNVIANNIANSNTNGFRKDTMVFNQYVVKDIKGDNVMPYDVANTVDFTQGSLSITSRPLDVAISGRGLFMVETPLGVRYTRNGNFLLNNEGVLVNSNGYKVLTADGGEIAIDGNLDTAPFIASDGSIRLGEANFGTIGIVDFNNYQKMKKTLEGLLETDEVPQIAQPARVVQGMLESSNVNSITEMTDMIAVQRYVGMTSNLINDLHSQSINAYKKISKLGN